MLTFTSVLIFLILFVVVVVIIVVALLAIRKKTSTESVSDTDIPWPLGVNADFLTAAEKSFFGVITLLLGQQYLICPKVSLSDVIFIHKGTDNGMRQSLFNRISRKHLDFILLDKTTLIPVAAIELDDSSHQSVHAKQRDAVKNKALLDAGLKLIRIPVKHTYTVNDIKDALADHTFNQDDTPQSITTEAQKPDDSGDSDQVKQTQPPICPKCQVEMVERKASRGPHAGQTFWGCPNYPHCRETIQNNH